jgi:hypothetical protein
MNSGKYVGPNIALHGRTAILREPIVTRGEPEGMIMAQFDFVKGNEYERDGPYSYLCYGWHPFQREDFTND